MTSSVANCIFCDIVGSRAPASRVYEDDAVLAFLDIQPVTPGHTLVIPKNHVAYLADLGEEAAGAVFQVAHRLATSFRHSGLRCEGVNLFVADGAAAFQEVLHTHIHVFPRFAGDGFSINADWQRRTPAELDVIAIKVRMGLRSRNGADAAAKDETSRQNAPARR